MVAAGVIRRSESKSNWTINKSTPPVQWKSWQLCFTIFDCTRVLAHRFDPVSKVQSTAWKHASSPLPRKFRVVVLAHKVMATDFWNVDRIVLTILSTAAPSQEPTMLIRLALKKKRQGQLQCRVLFHHDSASANKSLQALAAIKYARFELLFTGLGSKWLLFLQCAQCSHCKRCISYSNYVRLSVRHTPVLCQNDGT